jgi:hypothetical protein
MGMGTIRVSVTQEDIKRFLHMPSEIEIKSARMIRDDNCPEVLELTLWNPTEWCEFDYLKVPPLAKTDIVAHFAPDTPPVIPAFQLRILEIPPYTRDGKIHWTGDPDEENKRALAQLKKINSITEEMGDFAARKRHKSKVAA